MFDHITLRVPDLAAATRAFTAPTTAHVDRFARVASTPGLQMTGPPAVVRITPTITTRHLKDSAGNNFEAVHREGQRPSGNIDHVAIRVSDLDTSTVFYWTIADAVGLTNREQTADSTEFSLDESERSFIVIAGEPTQNVHVAFSGNDDEVCRFHADAIAAGYRSNGEPGKRPRHHAGYYAAYVLDPDGNNIEVVNHHRTRI